MAGSTLLPRAYRGKNHETIGSDVLALYHALQLPELLLGAEVARKIRELDPVGWYPIRTLLDPLEVVSEAVGPAGLRKVGRKLFQMSHAANVQKSIHSARALLYGFDGLYHNANRGEHIGGWSVVRFGEADAELDNTTPHHCALEEGIMDAALRAVGCASRIEQTSCVRTGAELCRFHATLVTPSPRWNDD